LKKKLKYILVLVYKLKFNIFYETETEKAIILLSKFNTVTLCQEAAGNFIDEYSVGEDLLHDNSFAANKSAD